jgi:putative flippase GtrA
MAKKPTKKAKKQSELVRITEYFISGGAWFWSGYLIIAFLDDRISLFWANFIGNTVGISLNYALQNYWVFKGKRAHTLHTTWLYIAYTVVNSFGLNYLILAALRKAGVEPEIGQFVAAGFFTVWNYYWYKNLIFVEKK